MRSTSATARKRISPRPTPAPSNPGEPEFLAKLNAKASKRARIAHDGSIAFGRRAIECFRLGNGLRVLVLVDATAPVVAYHTWIRVGSRHEIEGKTGLAHLFEHLMFKETKNLPAGTFDRKMEEAGAHTNAATWVDWTFYHEEVPSSQLPLVIRLEAERLRNLVLSGPSLESEREVVANERRYRVDDDVDGAMNELLYKLAFEKHPYHHPVIGWMDDILNFKTVDCRKFYKTYYAPNNATVVIVGDIALQKALAGIQKEYGEIASSVIPEETRVIEPAQTEERTLTLEKPTPTGKVVLGYHCPALDHVDNGVLSVMSEALFGGNSSRIYRELVTEKELASDLAASVSMSHDPGLFEIYMTAREGTSAAQLLEALDGCIDALAQKPVTEDERDRAVAQMELSFLRGLESVGGRAEQIGYFDTLVNDPAGSLARLEAMRAVELSSIAEAASRYLVRSKRTVILVNPGASETESTESDSVDAAMETA